MLRTHLGRNRALLLSFILLGGSGTALAQETRGSITGKVLDGTGAVVPGAKVTVTNQATGVASPAVTNSTGYYEVDFLVPGPYSVSAVSAGFKTLVRSGIKLNTGDRLAVDLQLQVGDVSSAVEVTSDAPQLETTNAAGGRVLDTRDIANLPITTMNPWALQAITPGAVFTGAPGINRVMDHAGTASYDIMGLGSGTNEFLLDGNPVTGTNGGRAGFVPSAEAVDEVRIETNPFDASLGHSVGAFISGTTKSGANAIHGSGFAQYMWYRINSTNEFTRANYLAQKAAGTWPAGTEENPGGRFFQPGFSFGGPVVIPKIYNGKNKLFFYFEWDHITSIQPSPVNVYYSVPTAAQRQGNFSDLQAYNATAYTIYDPRTAVMASNGHVTRTPFANNTIPTSLFGNNAFYKFFQQLYPLPNVTPSTPDGFNYFDPAQPYNDYLPSLVNRYDYNISNTQHLSGKWYYNHRFSDNYDWAHNTPLKGYESNGLWRPTRGGSLDYTKTFNANNILDITFSMTQYAEGDKQPIKNAYKASEAGLPTYIDTQAGGANGLPGFILGTCCSSNATPGIYANIASTSYEGYSGPGVNQRGTTNQLAGKMSTVLGRHTLKYGVEERAYHYATFLSGACTTGCYTFDNAYFKQADNTTNAGQLGLSWAAFMTGMASGASIANNDTGYYSTPYTALYLQDDFRLTSKLRLGFGLRFEREGGTTERFNRGLSGSYDFSFTPFYAQAVQTAYSTGGNSLLPSSIKVSGGPTYLGQPYSSLTDGTNRFLPNVSAVYAWDAKTAIRFGTGMFADTFNALGGTSNRELQNGFSQSTSTQISSDNGLTFCCGIGAASNFGNTSVIANPFPINATTGQRFVQPAGNTLGANILDGQGFTYYPRDFSPTWSQRWRLSIQREIAHNQVLDVSYNGSYASSPATRNLSYLPAQYWNFTDSLNTAVDNAMKATVANPFLYTNFSSLASSNAAVYNYLSSVGWFTGKTLQVQQLLRGNLNSGAGLSEYGGFRAKTMYNDLEVLYTKRFSHGVQSAVMFTKTWSRNQWQQNQFDQALEWQPNPNSRPNRFVWTWVWELPFGRGRQWVQHGLAQHVVGGWQMSGIYQYQTGSLIAFGNVYYYGTLDQLVTALDHSATHDKYIHSWYSTAADYNNLINSAASATGAIPSGFVGFEGRSAFQPGTYQARLMPQYVDGLRADCINNLDVRLQRKFVIHERLNASFAVDLLNAANRVQYSAPNVSPSSSTFGQVTAQANGPRQVQFNLRIEF